MKLSKFLGLFLAVFLIAISVSVFIWSSIPVQVEEEEIPVQVSGHWQEGCIIQLAWMPLVRTGDMITINMQFGDRDRRSCLESLEDLFPNKNLLIEASLIFPGIKISPQNTFIAPLTNGQNMRFSWNVSSAAGAGRQKGTLWVFLNTVSQAGDEKGHHPILAREIIIESRSLFGIDTRALRTFSLLGILAGIYLSLRNMAIINP